MRVILLAIFIFSFNFLSKGQCPGGKSASGTELIVNGDFSQGNVGFTSQYGYCNSSGCLLPYGVYTVGTDPSVYNQYWIGSDHTTGSGNFMMINGNNLTTLSVWCESVTVKPNTVYVFSGWLNSLYPYDNPAMLEFDFNGITVGSTFSAPQNTGQWLNFTQTWNSGTDTSVSICIYNESNAVSGNDFGLDDLSFKQCGCGFTANAGSDTSLCTGNSIQLTSTTADKYNWFPSIGLSCDTCEVTTASPLLTTTYSLSASANGCDDTAQVVVTVYPAINSFAGPDTVLCKGQSVQLRAAGGTLYNWLPSAGLSNSTIANPTATPTVSTTYTLTVSNGVCAGKDLVTVKLSSVNALIFMPSSPQVCPGQGTAISVSGGSEFNWSPSATLNKAMGDTVLASLPLSVDSLVFTVTGLDLSGCPDTGFVTLHSGGGAFGGIVTAPRDTICPGTSGNLTLIGNSNNVIQWQSSTDDINYANLPDDTLSPFKTAPLNQTTWFQAIVGSGNCQAKSDSIELIVPPELMASFYSLQTGSNQLTFNSDSSSGSIISYHWDFGDKLTSNEKNPVHTYAKDTTYYVCLTLYDGSNCSYTFCRYEDFNDGVPMITGENNWIIYPNPFNNRLNIKANESVNRIVFIRIYDVLGRIVMDKEFATSGYQANPVTIDVSGLTNGMYFLNIKTDKNDYMNKVIKQ